MPEETSRLEHAVTPLELFFDLVFVFAITQVTNLLTHEPTWHGYLLVRLFHLVLYANAGRDDPDLLGALLRLAPTELLGASLIVVAGFLSGEARIGAWLIALAIDYTGPAVVAMQGWRIAPAHFAERHGLIVLIALGESIVAIGVGAGFTLTTGSIAGAVLGVVVISALWWLYFDVAAIFARRQLVQASGVTQTRLARDASALAALGLVSAVCSFVVAYEALRYRSSRIQIRHPEVI